MAARLVAVTTPPVKAVLVVKLHSWGKVARNKTCSRPCSAPKKGCLISAHMMYSTSTNSSSDLSCTLLDYVELSGNFQNKWRIPWSRGSVLKYVCCTFEGVVGSGKVFLQKELVPFKSTNQAFSLLRIHTGMRQNGRCCVSEIKCISGSGSCNVETNALHITSDAFHCVSAEVERLL